MNPETLALVVCLVVFGILIRRRYRRIQGVGDASLADLSSPREVARELQRGEVKALHRAFAAVAGRLDGEVQGAADIESPRMSFRHRLSRGVLCVTQSRVSPRSLHTQVVLSMPTGWNRRLEVVGGAPARAWARPAGLDRVATQSAGLVSSFEVWTDAPARLAEVLTPEVRGILEDWGRRFGVHLSIDPSRMLMRLPGIITETGRLGHFVSDALRILDVLTGIWQKESGIEILDDGVDDPGPVICPVCASALENSGVQCRTCGTPHHPDCWDYNNGCSTFGCDGKTAGG